MFGTKTYLNQSICTLICVTFYKVSESTCFSIICKFDHYCNSFEFNLNLANAML